MQYQFKSQCHDPVFDNWLRLLEDDETQPDDLYEDSYIPVKDLHFCRVTDETKQEIYALHLSDPEQW